MAGGWKVCQLNTQERAVSTDLNRLQAFKGADVAEMMRFWLNVGTGTDDLDAAAVTAEVTAQGNPLLAEVLNGFLVKPQGGTLNLLVDKGVMFAINPDGGADDSVYKYVRDAGVLVAGTLSFDNNVAAGAIRVDLVEVAVSDNIVETDNRDIFQPANGTFAATNVTKARAGGLTYRVRKGAPGAGFPGTAQGWLPLMVASIPDGATTVDVMTFWDVRPLVNDRDPGPGSPSLDMPIIRRVDAYGNATDNAGQLRVSGIVDAVLNGRRIGGRLRRGSPGTSTGQEYVDFRLAANQDPGANAFAATHTPFFIYLATPFGLPRWARYTDGPNGRVPRSPRGIPIISTTGPLSLYGTPSVPVGLPAATGLGGTTSSALCVIGSNTSLTANLTGFAVDGKTTWNPVNTALAALVAGSVATWTLTENTHHPANARALVAEVSYAFNVPDGSILDYNTGAGGLTITAPGRTEAIPVPMVSNAVFNNSGATVPSLGQRFGVIRIPLPTAYPTSAPGLRTLTWTANTALPATVLLNIFGWEF